MLADGESFRGARHHRLPSPRPPPRRAPDPPARPPGPVSATAREGREGKPAPHSPRSFSSTYPAAASRAASPGASPHSPPTPPPRPPASPATHCTDAPHKGARRGEGRESQRLTGTSTPQRARYRRRRCALRAQTVSYRRGRVDGDGARAGAVVGGSHDDRRRRREECLVVGGECG